MSGIPKKWIGCPKFAKNLIADKFFVYKTPLKSSYSRSIQQNLRDINCNQSLKGGEIYTLTNETFAIQDILDHFEKLEILPSSAKGVNTWIDLTNTDRYFSPEEIKSAGITYHKLAMPGGPDCSPSPFYINKFIEICQTAGDGLVGVHCTHGFNRTGFLICAYLCEVTGWTVDRAIAEFKENRPPGIYRPGLLEKLVEKYRGSDESKVPPPTPHWLSLLEPPVGGSRPRTVPVASRASRSVPTASRSSSRSSRSREEPSSDLRSIQRRAGDGSIGRSTSRDTRHHPRAVDNSWRGPQQGYYGEDWRQSRQTPYYEDSYNYTEDWSMNSGQFNHGGGGRQWPQEEYTPRPYNTRSYNNYNNGWGHQQPQNNYSGGGGQGSWDGYYNYEYERPRGGGRRGQNYRQNRF